MQRLCVLQNSSLTPIPDCAIPGRTWAKLVVWQPDSETHRSALTYSLAHECVREGTSVRFTVRRQNNKLAKDSARHGINWYTLKGPVLKDNKIPSFCRKGNYR